MPLTNEKIVLFFELSASETLSDRMIRVKFMTPAAPRPCSARPSKSIPQVTDEAQSTLPTRIQNICHCSAECRPYISAICPEIGTNVVRVSVYAATIQLKLPLRWSNEVSLCLNTAIGTVYILKCEDILGTAGATIVTSTAARKLGSNKPMTIFHRRIRRLFVSAAMRAFSSALSSTVWLRCGWLVGVEPPPRVSNSSGLCSSSCSWRSGMPSFVFAACLSLFFRRMYLNSK